MSSRNQITIGRKTKQNLYSDIFECTENINVSPETNATRVMFLSTPPIVRDEIGN